MPVPVDAMKMIGDLRWALQKARSNADEVLEGRIPDAERRQQVLASINAWVWDAKGEALLSALVKVEDRGSVTAQELFNFGVIVHQLAPEVGLIYSFAAEGQSFPEPTIDAMREWLR